MDANKQAYWLLKPVNRAIREFGMLRDGDRVAVAFSGGKDSLALLHLLALRQKQALERYDLLVLHVAGDARGAETPPHPPLLDWLAQSGFRYEVEPFALSPGETLPLECARCAWNRRKLLFAAADRLGCNVVAFGHHADDLAETTLLNLLDHGVTEGMAPVREFFDGRLRLIRPLCYVSEAELRRFARALAQAGAAPEPPPLCPQSVHSRRALAKRLLAEAMRENKDARTNLLRAGLRGLGFLK